MELSSRQSGQGRLQGPHRGHRLGQFDLRNPVHHPREGTDSLRHPGC